MGSVEDLWQPIGSLGGYSMSQHLINLYILIFSVFLSLINNLDHIKLGRISSFCGVGHV